MFVCIVGCDYYCDWCDFVFIWDGFEKLICMIVDEVIAVLDKLGNYDYVILFGGNFVILAVNMVELVIKFKERGVIFVVEI